MAKKAVKKLDRRELPAYSISEVAHYLTVPDATIRYWATGQDNYEPLIEIPANRPALLSFINLVELHVLAAIRRKHTVPMPKVRAAIEYLKKNTRSANDKRHPLISKQLETGRPGSFYPALRRIGEYQPGRPNGHARSDECCFASH